MSTRVLIVEDSPTQAEALLTHLEEAGYAVTSAVSGEEGLRAFAAGEYDLVISDIVMPGDVDGYALCRGVKDRASETPVVLLTSLSDPMDIIRGLEAGADNFLTKPYEPEHLLDRVSLLLTTRRLRKTRTAGMGVKVFFMGREYEISADREQILDMLVTTFEEAVQHNQRLKERDAELSRAQAELAQYAQSLEARLERVMANVPDVLFSLSPDLSEVHYVSPAARNVFECEPEDFDAEFLLGHVHPEDRDALREAFDDVRAGSASADLEYRFQARTGERWIHKSLRAEGNGSPETIERIDGIARDVTARHDAERAVRESEERLRGVLDYSPAVIYAKDIEGRYLFVNRQYEKLFGLSEAELRGKTDYEIHPAGVADAVTANDRQVLGQNTPMHLEELVGDRTYVSVKFPLWEPDGTAYAVCGISTDITDRKEAEEAVKRSEARFRSLIEATSQIIWWTDAEGQVTTPLPSWQAFTGQNDEDVLGLGTVDAMHPDDRDAVVATWGEAVVNGTPFDLEYRLRRHDGAYRLMHARGVPVPNPDGSVREWVGTCEDVTNQRTAEEALRQSQKMEAVGRLAGGVAHDFNNLLSVILGETELALLDLPEDAPGRETIEEVRKAGERAAGLTRQLLAFSRRSVVHPTSFHVNDVVEELDKMLGRLLPEQVHLRARLGEDLPPVRMDRGQLEQVLVNLVVNARDAMPGGGVVTVATDRVHLGGDQVLQHGDVKPGPYIVLSVSDTGTGMGADVKRRIFEPFFSTKGEQGTGLGLATCYALVQQAGGHITVYSEEGYGTTMRVYVPLAIGARAVVDEEAGALPRGDETILLVEDDEAVRGTTSRLLQSLGYVVVEAPDGESAILQLRKDPDVELILTDVVLPTMNGREVADEARKLRPGLPVLYSSGYSDDEQLRRALHEADAVLVPKPVMIGELARKVRAALDGADRR